MRNTVLTCSLVGCLLVNTTQTNVVKSYQCASQIVRLTRGKGKNEGMNTAVSGRDMTLKPVHIGPFKDVMAWDRKTHPSL